MNEKSKVEKSFKINGENLRDLEVSLKKLKDGESKDLLLAADIIANYQPEFKYLKEVVDLDIISQKDDHQQSTLPAQYFFPTQHDPGVKVG